MIYKTTANLTMIYLLLYQASPT